MTAANDNATNKEESLAQALRKNLFKRKQQQRDRLKKSQLETPPPSDSPEPPPPETT